MAGYRVAIFSLEMLASSVGLRMVSLLAGIDSLVLSRGQVPVARADEYRSALATMRGLEKHLFIDDTSMTVDAIGREVDRMGLQGGVDLIVVDYLQLAASRDGDNRVGQVTLAAEGLKGLAMKTNAAILAPSQLSRQADAATPQLGHLRESGAIEHTASLVILLNAQGDSSGVEAIIAKNRHGAPGAIDLIWDRSLMRYTEAYKQIPGGSYMPWQGERKAG